MSVEPGLDVDVDLDMADNSAGITIRETRTHELRSVFNDDGELRLWQDGSGWSGYIREVGTFYEVSVMSDGARVSESEVTAEQVRDAILQHVEDPAAGGRGNFVRRCSPP